MIHARGLTRSFKQGKANVEAVKGLDIDVREGELVAFLGPNGAGKSTSLKMLTTLLPPSSGTALVAGHDILREPAAVRRAIGYVGQGTASGQYHRVRDELVTQGIAQRMGKPAAKKRADELLGALELDSAAERVASTLSGGQKRRLDVALGMMHSPRLLFLDEPSTGLDPHSRANLWEHILKLRQSSGTTIFLTTHYLDEADSMAERVLVIDGGLLIADDTPEKLKADLAGDRLTVTVTGHADAGRAVERAQNLPSARNVSLSDSRIEVTVREGEAMLPEFLRVLAGAGIDVAAASVKRPTLDDVFLGLTGRSLREAGAA